MNRQMKKLFIGPILLAMILLLSGCANNRYPVVSIDESRFESIIEICIGQPYKYDSFDVTNTDNGKDLVLHFIRETEESYNGK